MQIFNKKSIVKAMALFIRQTEERTKLQQRLAAELQEKAKARDEHAAPDGVTDSQYLVDTKQTTSLAWVWVAIFVVAIIAAIVIFYR